MINIDSRCSFKEMVRDGKLVTVKNSPHPLLYSGYSKTNRTCGTNCANIYISFGAKVTIRSDGSNGMYGALLTKCGVEVCVIYR